MQAMNNVFYEMMFYMSDEKRRNDLMNASVMWDTMTNNGKNPDDTALYTVLDANNLSELIALYEANRKNTKEFDSEALKAALEYWCFSNN